MKQQPLVVKKTIAAGQTDYNNNTAPHTYTDSLANLANGTNAGNIPYIDPNLGSGIKSGYTFSMVTGNAVQTNGEDAYWAWSSCTWPISYQSTGVRSFYIDESGVIRGSDVSGACGTVEMPAID